MTVVTERIGAGPPLGVTLFGALGGLVLAALLFGMVCVACVAVLALLHAVLPTGPAEQELGRDADAAEPPVEAGEAEGPAAPIR